jgi:hypothetical protein
MSQTVEEILEMPAGRELDALLGEMLGLAQQARWEGFTALKSWPAYSTDIAAAFQAFAGKGWMLYENLENDANRWFVFADDRALEDWRPAGWGETAPLAICRALLKSFVR